MSRVNLSDEDRKIFNLVVEQVFQLHGDWRTYQDVIDEPNFPLLNATAPAFFKTIEQSLRTSIYLNVCRLVDKDQTKMKKETLDNLTLNRLLEIAKRHGPSKHFDEMDATLAAIRAASEVIQKLRHKAYGHNDLETALSREKLLPKVTRDDTTKVADLIADFVNQISDFVDDGGVFDFRDPFRGGDGKDLLAYLKRGCESFEEDDRPRMMSEPPPK